MDLEPSLAVFIRHPLTPLLTKVLSRLPSKIVLNSRSPQLPSPDNHIKSHELESLFNQAGLTRKSSESFNLDHSLTPAILPRHPSESHGLQPLQIWIFVHPLHQHFSGQLSFGEENGVGVALLLKCLQDYLLKSHELRVLVLRISAESV